MLVKCPNCHFENPEGFAFCGRCGTRLAAADPSVSAFEQREATVKELKEAGDAAKRAADVPAALERYQRALSLLDSATIGSDATLHVQLLKQRFDILAERYALWPANGQPDRVESDLQEMLALARRAGDGARLSKAISALAQLYVGRRQFEPARPVLEEAVSLFRSQGDRAGEASALAELAHASWRAGKFDGVANALQRAHELRRHLGEPGGLARSYFDLGLLYRDGLSQPYHAVNHFEKSLEFARLIGDAELETRGLIGTGASWTRLGEVVRARAALDVAQNRIGENRATEQAIWLVVAQADLLRESQSPDAIASGERAVRLAAEKGEPDVEWNALAGLVRIAQATGNWLPTLASIQHMQALEQSGGTHAYCTIWSDALLARSHLHLGQTDLARAAAARASGALEAHGPAGVPAPQLILWTQFEVLDRAREPSAVHYLRQAREAMLTQANTIGDGALRAHFLRDVAVNRAIGDDWARVHT